MKFFIKNFFSKYDQIRSFLQNGSDLLKKSLMENFISFAVTGTEYSTALKQSRALVKSRIIQEFFYEITKSQMFFFWTITVILSLSWGNLLTCLKVVKNWKLTRSKFPLNITLNNNFLSNCTILKNSYGRWSYKNQKQSLSRDAL